MSLKVAFLVFKLKDKVGKIANFSSELPNSEGVLAFLHLHPIHQRLLVAHWHWSALLESSNGRLERICAFKRVIIHETIWLSKFK